MTIISLLSQDQIFLVAIGIAGAWLLALTVLVWQVLQHYRSLTQNITKKDLKTVLDGILRETKFQAKTSGELKEKLARIEQDGFSHLQRIGFLRFNPFADTGGDQSFILAFLDEKNNGIVFSSMHGRGTTRLYAKQVVQGKGKDFELSDEEKKVIQQARKLK
ncbi:hypothetical protein A2160_00310 [Candidatus Beckwithbacteria bacterium RBG_13_42_9]|uniref:DUF4446 domain-containing protein n=1 Tax=Candidatus Beckwithbacteria bacterium RBG_13_42_9 TaxID=1797457 RepID=A0A1F5E560_9BACT|nr:MAG: hypothetical protein A2160_00310 [Candidatus Beckwithbacteria bacterium RBG_13_42_9]